MIDFMISTRNIAKMFFKKPWLCSLSFYNFMLECSKLCSYAILYSVKKITSESRCKKKYFNNKKMTQFHWKNWRKFSRWQSLGKKWRRKFHQLHVKYLWYLIFFRYLQSTKYFSRSRCSLPMQKCKFSVDKFSISPSSYHPLLPI